MQTEQLVQVAIDALEDLKAQDLSLIHICQQRRREES